MHNSCRPLDPLTLTFTFDLDHIHWFIGGQGIVMAYPVPSLVILDFFSFSRFVFIVRTDRETDRRNHRGGSALAYTHADTVGVRKIVGTSTFGVLAPNPPKIRLWLVVNIGCYIALHSVLVYCCRYFSFCARSIIKLVSCM